MFLKFWERVLIFLDYVYEFLGNVLDFLGKSFDFSGLRWITENHDVFYDFYCCFFFALVGLAACVILSGRVRGVMVATTVVAYACGRFSPSGS
jgi:hypothetical protein